MESSRSTSGETRPDRVGTGVEPPEPDTAPTTAEPVQPTRRTRTSGAWTGVIAGAVVLLLLLIFILENTQRVKISYLGANGHLPLGVALLLAAVAGALVVGMVGAARVLQLRKLAKRAERRAQG
ncbi:MAG: lipopolysaccharide assembly protein LapA domain-containing protein [Thermoleophilaceae bacterium]